MARQQSGKKQFGKILDGISLAQIGLGNVVGGDGKVASFNNSGYDSLSGGVKDMAFRLYGSNANVIPEPGTLVLTGLSLALLGFTGRRRPA